MTLTRRARDPIFGVTLVFVLLVLFMPALRPLFVDLFPGVEPPVYARESFLALFLSHAGIVALAGLISAIAGIGIGIAVTRSWGREFRAIAEAVAAIGQTIPPVAVLAIAVPMLGFGARPTLVALALYGLMPVLGATIAGLDAVPAPVREAAQAMGMGPAQLLRRIELPLAAPVILAGLRISIIFDIGTATVGSTVGAATLGTPIIDGLVSDKLNFAIQGAVLVALFAVITDLAFERLGAWIARHL